MTSTLRQPTQPSPEDAGAQGPPEESTPQSGTASQAILLGFVEHTLAGKLASEQGRGSAGTDARKIDWEAIRTAARGAATVERASDPMAAAALLNAREGTALRDYPATDSPDTDVRRGQERELVLRTPVNAPDSLDQQPPLPSAETSVLTDSAPHPGQHLVQRELRRRLAWASFFGWVRNVGGVILLFVAWQLWGTAISQHHDQQQLASAFSSSVRSHHVAKSSTPSLLSATTPVPQPAEGSVVAQLQVPAIELSEYVVSGTADSDLARGPGHYIGTAVPGQAGNVAIAGHRTTNGAPFNRLGDLSIGNPIFLTTTSGQRFTYIVSQKPYAVSPNDVTVLDNFGDNRITLTTCNPEFSASQRLIVVGELKGPAAAPVSSHAPVAYHVMDPATASWDWVLLPIVGLEASLLILLGLNNKRFMIWFGRSGRWLILVPLWTTGLYLLFQTLTAFVPATL